MIRDTETVSPYYPPRARWYSRFFCPVVRARRVLHLDNIRLPCGFSFLELILTFALPGFAFFALGRRMWGCIFVAAYCFGAAIFVIALGYLPGSAGLGLAVSTHAISIVFFQGSWLREAGFQLRPALAVRLVLAVGTLFGIWLGVYSPLLGFAGRHWVMPLRTPERVLVVNCHVSARAIARGDWIAFQVEEFHGNELYVRAGYGVEQVHAVAGDTIRFTPEHFEINGVDYPRQPNMPTAGETVVPEKHWFVWPNLAISGHGRANEIYMAKILQTKGMIAQSELVGKPFKRWFFRRQLP